MGDRGKKGGFALEIDEPEGSRPGIGVFVNHLLDSGYAFDLGEAQITSGVDGAHPAAADDLLNLVATLEDRARREIAARLAYA